MIWCLLADRLADHRWGMLFNLGRAALLTIRFIRTDSELLVEYTPSFGSEMMLARLGVELDEGGEIVEIQKIDHSKPSGRGGSRRHMGPRFRSNAYSSFVKMTW